MVDGQDMKDRSSLLERTSAFFQEVANVDPESRMILLVRLRIDAISASARPHRVIEPCIKHPAILLCSGLSSVVQPCTKSDPNST